MDIKEALTIIKVSLENTAIAAVKSLKAHVFRVDIGEKRFEVVNFPKVQQIEGKVAVVNQQDLEKQLKVVNEWLGKVQETLKTLKPFGEIRVTNFPKFEFPAFPKEMKVSEPVTVSEKSFQAVLEALGELTAMVKRLPTEYPEVKIPPFPKMPPFPEFPRIPAPLKTVSVDNLEKLMSSDPKKYVPVRLSDGERFYKALEELSIAAGRSYAYSDSRGAKQQALVDGDRHVQADIVSMPPIEVKVGDVEIGAVEVKDGESDTRAKVGANGLEVEVKASALPEGAATAGGQDALLTELGKKADNNEIQPVQLTDIDLLTRFFLRSLRQLSIDSAGRLRVAAESLATLGTLTTLTNITNWGALNATSRTQVDTHMAYQQGFRRNLVVT